MSGRQKTDNLMHLVYLQKARLRFLSRAFFQFLQFFGQKPDTGGIRIQKNYAKANFLLKKTAFLMLKTPIFKNPVETTIEQSTFKSIIRMERWRGR